MSDEIDTFWLADRRQMRARPVRMRRLGDSCTWLAVHEQDSGHIHYFEQRWQAEAMVTSWRAHPPADAR